MSPAPSASEEVDGAYSASPSALLQQTPLSAVVPAAVAGLVHPSDSSRQIRLCLESSTIKRKGSEEEVPGTIYRTKGRVAVAAMETGGSRGDRQRHLGIDEGKERIIRIEENGRRMTRGVDSSLQTIENNQRRSSKELVMGQGSQRMKMSKTRLEESHNEDIKNPIKAAATTTSRRSPLRSPYPAR